MVVPLVSIIIPCYNAESYVAQAIQSALSQTHAACEVIVIDDGSTDGSLELIESFGCRIRWDSGPNRGGCAARNRGLAMANGDWIQFLDADDWLGVGKIEAQIRALAENDLGTVANCAWRYFEGNRMREQSAQVFWKNYPNASELLVDMWLGGGFFNPACWLVSRQLIDEVGLWNEALAADQDGEFFGRVLLKARNVVFCGEVEAYYRTPQEHNVSRSVSDKALWSKAEAIRILAERLGGAQTDRKSRGAIRRRWLNFAYFSSHYSQRWMEYALAELEMYPGSREWPDQIHGAGLRILTKIFGVEVAISMRRRLRLLSKAQDSGREQSISVFPWM
ncbi:MAG: glycosyltransferase [Verrucomicrobiales bacterium]|nr:glycosyltransferase [Verrucomicrobiales bacterium]